MATLYRKADGQLVIDTTLPPGGSIVILSPTNNGEDLIPWYRSLDTTNLTEWDPANFVSTSLITEVNISGVNQITGNVSFGTSKTGLPDASYGYNNIALGSAALSTPDTEKMFNIAIGTQALFSSIGSYNVAIGTQSLYSNFSGIQNIALGDKALYLNTDGNNNIAIGNGACFSNTGYDNTALGFTAGYYSTGNNNVFIGSKAGINLIMGNGNTFLGNYGYEAIGPPSNNAIYISDGAGNLKLQFTAGYWNTTYKFLVTEPTGGIGYSGAAIGSVVQLTSKSTDVSLNALAGTITVHGASLAAGASVSFLLHNTAIAAADNILIARDNVTSILAYSVEVCSISTNACRIVIRNVSNVALAENFAIRFTIFKLV